MPRSQTSSHLPFVTTDASSTEVNLPSIFLRRRPDHTLNKVATHTEYPPEKGARQGEVDQQQALLAAEAGEPEDPEMILPTSTRKPPAQRGWLRRRNVLLALAVIAACLLLFTRVGRDPSSSRRPGSAIDDARTRPASGASSSCSPIPGRPSQQYALMIDAGSTGSRIHVYDFAFCSTSNDPKLDAQSLPTLRHEGFFQLQPGLSAYSGRPREAAESLRPLLEEAVKAIPKSDRPCTPIAVKATAGLRLLGAAESQAILLEVSRWLKAEWPFSVVADGVTIMDGRDEGVYAWITINYLLGLLNPSRATGQSAAVMDLGGASTQIVFEPELIGNLQLSPGDHIYELTFAQAKRTLYQHSYLGFGLMQARRSVHNLVAFTWVWQGAPLGIAREWQDLSERDEIPSPCLVRGGRKVVELDPPGRPKVKVTFVGTGAGFDACRRVVDVVMAKDALCEVEPCAFGGVYQPSLMQTFGHGPIYALSYFYDRIKPLGLGVDSAPFSIGELGELAYAVCQGPEAGGWQRFHHSTEAMAELEDRPEYCLDLTFMHSLLSLGYELADTREVRVGKKIDEVELGWCLGAAIAMLDGKLECVV